eukprot:241831-Amorphochlora_amoeboformis.AAC.1
MDASKIFLAWDFGGLDLGESLGDYNFDAVLRVVAAVIRVEVRFCWDSVHPSKLQRREIQGCGKGF